MALELKQNLKTLQRLSLSTELRTSITILGLGRVELEKFISEELQKNPCLIAANKKQTSIKTSVKNLVDVQARDIPDNSEHISLHTNIYNQISMMRLSLYELNCVQILIQYIDDNGYLSSTLDEISKLHEIYLDDLKYALSLVQKCDPPGLGARNLQDSLLLQMNRKNSVPKFTQIILEKYWDEFEKQNFNKIAKLEKTSVEVIKDAFRFIRKNLDPKPARQFGSETNQVIQPDVYLFKRDGEWVCSLNQDGLPSIKLSKRYQSLLVDLKETSQQKEAIKYISENTKSAKILIRSLEERNNTVLKVTEIILRYQKDFFDKGIDFLVPMTLKDVANELNMHESTISRSTSGKYLFFSRGLFELKYFFNQRVEAASGKDVANESIKQWVLDYINNEDKANPMSDNDIALKITEEKGLTIARRTVSKYREAMNILSSSKRSKRF